MGAQFSNHENSEVRYIDGEYYTLYSMYASQFAARTAARIGAGILTALTFGGAASLLRKAESLEFMSRVDQQRLFDLQERLIELVGIERFRAAYGTHMIVPPPN